MNNQSRAMMTTSASANLISAVEAAGKRGVGGVVWVDVRTPVEHGGVHIDGVRLEPLDRLDAGKLAEEVDGREVLVVCRSGNRAKLAAEKLRAAGVDRVWVMEGGMQGWEAAGLPVVRGAQVMSLERQVRIAAGVLILVGVVLGTWGHPAFYGLSAFVGAGLIFAGVTDWCGMGMMLARAPWNRVVTRPVASGAAAP